MPIRPSVALLLALCGCTVSPNNADAVSRMLVIPGAQRVEGPPPAPGGGTGPAPTVTGPTQLSVNSGDAAELWSEFTSESGHVETWVQVAGADEHFVLTATAATATGEVRVPFVVPASLGTGAFRLSTRIAGENGAVSLPHTVMVGVTPRRGTILGGSGGSGGSTSCVDDFCGFDDASFRTCVNTSGTTSTCWYDVAGRRFECAADCDCSDALILALDYCEGF